MLADKVNQLNAEMHAALVEFLKEHNGFIRTDNHMRGDTMYAYLYNIESAYEAKECAILAVCLTDNDQVAILPDYTNGCENLEGLTDEEILASEEWELLLGGECVANATAYQLCEGIEEYIP